MVDETLFYVDVMPHIGSLLTTFQIQVHTDPAGCLFSLTHAADMCMEALQGRPDRPCLVWPQCNCCSNNWAMHFMSLACSEAKASVNGALNKLRE